MLAENRFEKKMIKKIVFHENFKMFRKKNDFYLSQYKKGSDKYSFETLFF